MNTTIIIGTCAAGIAAAGKLRELDPSATIICVSKESQMPYNRCLLADYLGGSRNEQQVRTKGQQFFDEKNIELKLNTQVIGLDVASNKIMLSDGSQLSYSTLVIATGRSAFIPPPLDVRMSGVVPFYDLEHVTTTLDYIEKNQVKRVLVVGAGITGLECIDALLGKGLSIIAVERNAQVLARQIDMDGALFLQNLLKSKGVTLHLETTVTVIEKKDSGMSVMLSSGKHYEVDLVLAATGGRQNLDFAKAAGVACDEFGIITNEIQATNIPNIFAAGDVCSVISLVTGNRTSNTLWPDAVAQGLTAAHSIVGLCKPYAGTLNITSTNILGTTLVTCGDFEALAGLDTLGKKEADFYHKFYMNDGILQAFVMVGNVGGVGQLRKSIVEKTRIT
jgi:NAD(P)H-nitrite reductase large subunit